MLVFHKVRYRNFLSSGDHFVEIDLDKHKTNILVGKNGNGKCFCLNSKIKLRNKTTGDILEITVGEFYELQKKQNN
jgi:predicted ATP-binding protein involved in virulence